MTTPTNNTPITRDQVVPLLVQRFTNDYQSAIIHYKIQEKLELTEHLLFAVDLMALHAQTDNEDIYYHYLELEDELLQKYRKAFKPYIVKQFFRYFWFDKVLVEKGIYTQEEFNSLSPDWQRLLLDEITDFVDRCKDILYHARGIILLQMDSNIELPEMPGSTQPALPEPSTQGKDITKARQLLAIYYLLKAGWDIEHRENQPISAIARFAHLLTGTQFVTLQNSDIYKKYSLMPNYKKGEQLIADLEFIRPYFEMLHIDKAVQLINEELRRTVKELPFGTRDKYRNKEE